ncbi:helix-turn-helix domain-containing protein [Streptomyces sp. NPDC055085]
MQLRYSFRLYPDPGQQRALAGAFGAPHTQREDGRWTGGISLRSTGKTSSNPGTARRNRKPRIPDPSPCRVAAQQQVEKARILGLQPASARGASQMRQLLPYLRTRRLFCLRPFSDLRRPSRWRLTMWCRGSRRRNPQARDGAEPCRVSNSPYQHMCGRSGAPTVQPPRLGRASAGGMTHSEVPRVLEA